MPRSCSSAWRTLSPVRTWTSTDSLNLALLSSLTSDDRLGGRVLARAVEALLGVDVCLAVLGHAQTTSTPIERAVPAMIFAAASMSLAFRSFIFFSAIARS